MTSSITTPNNQIPTAQPHQKTASGTITLAVGKKTFIFAKSTFNQPYVKDSVFEVYANNRWVPIGEIPFYDSDAGIFKKYFASYIRYGFVPKWNEVENPRLILTIANFFNLPKFIEEFKEAKHERKISILFKEENVKINLTVDDRLTIKQIVSKFIENYNKNIVKNKLGPDWVSLSTTNDTKQNIKLGIRLKNVENSTFFAFRNPNSEYKETWREMEDLEREREREMEKLKMKDLLPTSQPTLTSTSRSTLVPMWDSDLE